MSGCTTLHSTALHIQPRQPLFADHVRHVRECAARSGTSFALRSRICPNCSHAALVILTTATGCLRGAIALVPPLLLSREYGLGYMSPNFQTLSCRGRAAFPSASSLEGQLLRERPPRTSACARCCTSHFTLRFFFFSTPHTGYVRRSYPKQRT